MSRMSLTDQLNSHLDHGGTLTDLLNAHLAASERNPHDEAGDAQSEISPQTTPAVTQNTPPPQPMNVIGVPGQAPQGVPAPPPTFADRVGAIGQVVSQIAATQGTRGVGGELAAAIERQVPTMARSIGGAIELGGRAVGSVAPWIDPSDAITVGQNLQAVGGAVGALTAPTRTGGVMGSVNTAADVVGQTVPGIAATAINPALGAAVFAAQGGGDLFTNARDIAISRGMDPAEATERASKAAAIFAPIAGLAGFAMPGSQAVVGRGVAAAMEKGVASGAGKLATELGVAGAKQAGIGAGTRLTGAGLQKAYKTDPDALSKTLKEMPKDALVDALFGMASHGVVRAGAEAQAASEARTAADVQARGEAIRGASDQYRQAQEAGRTQTPDFARQTPEQQAASQGAADELLKPPPAKAPEVTPEQQAAFLKAQDAAKAEFRKQAGLPPEEVSAPTPAPQPPAPPVNLVEEAKRLRTDPNLTDEERADALQRLFRDARVREAQARLRDAEKPQPKQVLTDRAPTPEEMTAAGDSGLEDLLNRPQTPPETPDAGGVQGSLIARGRYQQQTRRALIVEARARELSTAGTKDDLVQRLMDDDQQQQEANDAQRIPQNESGVPEAGNALEGRGGQGSPDLELKAPGQPGGGQRTQAPAGESPRSDAGNGAAPPAPASPSLARMTRPQLVKEARRRGVPAGGTAEELRARLSTNDGRVADEAPQPKGQGDNGPQAESKLDQERQQNQQVENESSHTPKSTGIAHDVTAARGTAAERGEGITPEESAARGRELIDKHLAKPEQVVSDFEKTGKISGDDMAVVGEHARQLQMARDLAESTKGKDSPEFKEAFDAETAWIKRIKPMQTEWHKSGQAQQAVRSEVDTSTFGGLRRAFVDAHDKDLTPAQERVADATAKRVREATKATDEARAKLTEAAGIAETEAEGAKAEPAKPTKASRPSTQKVSDQVLAKIQSAADAARERIKSRGTRLMSGVDPFDIADHVIVGASHIANGIVKFADWSTQMLADFGDGIKPRLKEIYNASVERFNSEAKGSPDFADHKPGSKMSPENVKALWKNAKGYIEKGMGFDDVVHKLAADHGLPVNDIRRGLAQPKGARALTDDMYRKQAAQRLVIQQAKQWVEQAGKPGWQRAAEKIPRAFFTAKVFGHGTVGMITHAGNQMLDPRVADHYWTNFARQFKLMGVHDAGAFHEQAMADLERRPNYITARRAGLANDPGKATDDYQKTSVGNMFGKLGLTGSRGFDALKIFRQDLFDHQWDALPESLKTKEMAQVIAADANHVTGTVNARVGGNVASTVFFAPKLEASRWATLIGDPAKAAKTIAVKLSGGEVTPHDWYQAVSQVKQKTIMAATLFSALAVNQGLLKATGSDQSINFSDPSKSDFLAFKAAGYKVSPISPLVGAIQFLHNMATASGGDYNPQATREERMTKIGEQYARGKLSPLAGFVVDNIFQNTLKDGTSVPVAWSSDPVSPRAAARGIGKETPLEMAGKAGLPIPLEAAINEALRGEGANDATAKKIIRAVAVMGITGGTGAHISGDNPPTTPPTPEAIKWSGFNEHLDQIRKAARSLPVAKRIDFINAQAATMEPDEQARLWQQVNQHQASWMGP